MHHHSRMVDWKFLVMLLLERRPVRDCSFPFDQIRLLSTTLFHKYYFRLIKWKKLNCDLFSHNFNVNDLYVCRFLKTNFANRYVAMYVSTYRLTSLFVTSRCVKKRKKITLISAPSLKNGRLEIFNHVTLGKEAS